MNVLGTEVADQNPARERQLPVLSGSSLDARERQVWETFQTLTDCLYYPISKARVCEHFQDISRPQSHPVRAHSAGFRGCRGRGENLKS